MIRILVNLNGRKRGDIVSPEADGGIWKHWLDGNAIFETSPICELVEEPEPEAEAEPEPKKPKRGRPRKEKG